MQFFSILLNFLFLPGHFALGLISKSHISVLPQPQLTHTKTLTENSTLSACEKTPVDWQLSFQIPPSPIQFNAH